MDVLRVNGLRGSGTGNGRHSTQKRTSAGLHTNLELGIERVNAAGIAQGCAPCVQIRRTVIREAVVRPIRPGGPCMQAAGSRVSGEDVWPRMVAVKATIVTAESRALELVRTAGLPLVWS